MRVQMQSGGIPPVKTETREAARHDAFLAAGRSELDVRVRAKVPRKKVPRRRFQILKPKQN